MPLIKFNANQFTGKKSIYVKAPGHQGICSVWDWNNAKQKYEKRAVGLKYYSYKKIAGRQFSKFFESFEQAKKWRESGDLFYEEKNSDHLFKEVKEKFLQHKTSKLRVSTMETYESHLKHLAFFDSFIMSQINSKAIDAWLSFIKKPEYVEMQHQTRMTYRHELSVLRQVLVYYSEYIDDSYQVPIKKRHLDDCIIDHSRYQQSKAKNSSRFIPRNDLEKFFEEIAIRAKAKPELMVYSVLAFVQFRGGLRIGEVSALDWKDVNLETGGVVISKNIQWSRKKGRPTCISPLTKTGESRPICLTNDVLEALKNWRTICQRSSGLIFSRNGFSPLSYRSVQYHYNNAFVKLGLPWRSTHIMRHSFATDFMENTQNQPALQKMLGHKSSRQTEHYAKITQKLTQSGMRDYEQTLSANQVVDLLAEKVKREEVAG